jgi:hypothetical protein
MSTLVGTSEAVVVEEGPLAPDPPTAASLCGLPLTRVLVIDDFNGRTVSSTSTGGYGLATCGATWTNGIFDGGYEPATHTIAVSGGVGTTALTISNSSGGNYWGDGLYLPDAYVPGIREEMFSFKFKLTAGNSTSQFVVELYSGVTTGAGSYAFTAPPPASVLNNYSVLVSVATNAFSGLEIGSINENDADSEGNSMGFTLGTGVRYQLDILLSDCTDYQKNSFGGPTPPFTWPRAATAATRCYPVGTPAPFWLTTPMYPGLGAIYAFQCGPQSQTASETCELDEVNLTLQATP